MDIRKLIREEIARLFKEADATAADPILGGALTDINGELQSDLDNMDLVIKKQEIDSKNRKNDIKAKLQIKSKLPADNPDRKGLNVSIPVFQSDDKTRDEQLQNLKDTQKGIIAAQQKLDKQKLDMEKQAKKPAAAGTEKTVPSVLPSLESPI